MTSWKEKRKAKKQLRQIRKRIRRAAECGFNLIDHRPLPKPIKIARGEYPRRPLSIDKEPGTLDLNDIPNGD